MDRRADIICENILSVLPTESTLIPYSLRPRQLKKHGCYGYMEDG